jgi:uncharacterized protein involved in outer membrane biogenesis
MRWKRFAAISVVIIGVLITSVYVYLNTYDYNKLKPLVSRMVEDATGRRLSIDGDINLKFGFSPSLVVTDASLANVSWASQPQMIEIDKLETQVRLLPLLLKDIEVTYIRLIGAKVSLEQGPDAKVNWRFKARSSSAGSAGVFKPAALDVNQIDIENLNLILHRSRTASKMQFTLSSLTMNRHEAEDILSLKLRADYNGQPLTLSGKTGQISQFFGHKRFALQLSGKLANVSVQISGAIDDILALQGIELETRLNGKNLETLGPILAVQLPTTNSFDVSMYLKGTGDLLKLENINGNLSGDSLDIAVSGNVGNLTAFSGVDLKLKSSGKDLAVMAPIIGEKLPATDQFEIQGRLTGSTEALSLQKARGSARRGSLRLTVDGAVKDLLAFKGMDLKSRLSGKDLSEFGEIIGVKLPTTDELEIQGRLTGSTAALSLQNAQGSTRRGSIELTVSGGIKNLLALGGINVKLKASGKEWAEIGPLIGAKLPDLGSFNVSGRLAGSAKTILLKEFSVMLDKSDFNGLAKVEILKRPKLTIRLKSSVIDFTALMKSLEQDEQKTAHKTQQKRRLFSDDPLPFDVLKKVDADIVLKAKNIQVKGAHFKFGHMALKLKNSDFSIDKLEATYKETKISGSLQINAGAPSQVAANFLVQNFNLGDFLKDTAKSDQLRAIVDIAAHGKSKGDSVHSLMASLNGSIGAVMGEGYLTKYLDMLSRGLSAKVIPFWRPAKTADQIKCAVVQFDIKQGIATSKAFVFDTRAGVLAGEGNINLGTEKINFLLVPKPAHPDLSILTNLQVSGSVIDPHVGVDKASTLTQGAKALSFLAVGPLGLLAPFVHLGANKSHPCEVQSIGQLGLNIPANK